MRAVLFWLVAIGGACSMSSPSGLLGLKWGDDAAQAAHRLGLACSRWEPWSGGGGFETCIDLDHPVTVLGEQGLARLIRQQGRIEAVQIVFRHCAARAAKLRAAAHRDLKLEKPNEATPYEVWHDGAVVHLASDTTDDTCTLTVAGPRFGKAFQDYLLKSGFEDLSKSLKPH